MKTKLLFYFIIMTLFSPLLKAEHAIIVKHFRKTKRIVINKGALHGLNVGDQLLIFEPNRPILIKGKKVRTKSRAVGRVKIEKMARKQSRARITRLKRHVKFLIGYWVGVKKGTPPPSPPKVKAPPPPFSPPSQQKKGNRQQIAKVLPSPRKTQKKKPLPSTNKQPSFHLAIGSGMSYMNGFEFRRDRCESCYKPPSKDQIENGEADVSVHDIENKTAILMRIAVDFYPFLLNSQKKWAQMIGLQVESKLTLSKMVFDSYAHSSLLKSSSGTGGEEIPVQGSFTDLMTSFIFRWPIKLGATSHGGIMLQLSPYHTHDISFSAEALTKSNSLMKDISFQSFFTPGIRSQFNFGGRFIVDTWFYYPVVNNFEVSWDKEYINHTNEKNGRDIVYKDPSLLKVGGRLAFAFKKFQIGLWADHQLFTLMQNNGVHLNPDTYDIYTTSEELSALGLDLGAVF